MGRGKKGAPGLFTAPLFDKISGVLQYACVHTVLRHRKSAMLKNYRSCQFNCANPPPSWSLVKILQSVRNEERKVKSEIFQRRQNAKSDHRKLLPGKAHVPRNRTSRRKSRRTWGRTLIWNFCVRFGIPSRNAGCFLRLPSDTKNGDHYKFLGNCPPTPPLSHH